jgi:hypothetical protein
MVFPRIDQHVNFGGSAVLGAFVASLNGVAEEARTRGFPSPSFDGFGFVSKKHSRALPNNH